MACRKEVAMNFVMILLTASLIISLIMLVLLGLFSFSHRSFNAKTRYFMWVILLIGLIIPFRPLLGNGLITVEDPTYILDQTDRISPEHDVTKAYSGMDKKGSDALSVEQKPENSIFMTQDSVFRNQLSMTDIVFVIWALGAILFLAKFVMEYRRFHRIIKRWGTPVTDDVTLETFEWVKARMGLENQAIGLLRVNMISTPMLTGLFKPIVLLPDKSIEDDEMELILEHELTHYKHKDLWINLLGVIALCIHWFNPILYLCMPAIYGEGESYCDETVLQNKSLDYRRFYGEVIISMIEASPQKHIALSTCFYAKKLNIKRRLLHIMESHSRRKKLSFAAVAFIFSLTFVSGSVIVFGAPESKEPIPSEQAKPITLRDVKGTSAEEPVVQVENVPNEVVYEAERYRNNMEYDYKTDANTGAILKQEKEIENSGRSVEPTKIRSATDSEQTIENNAKNSTFDKEESSSGKDNDKERKEDNEDKGEEDKDKKDKKDKDKDGSDSKDDNDKDEDNNDDKNDNDKNDNDDNDTDDIDDKEGDID